MLIWTIFLFKTKAFLLNQPHTQNPICHFVSVITRKMISTQTFRDAGPFIHPTNPSRETLRWVLGTQRQWGRGHGRAWAWETESPAREPQAQKGPHLEKLSLQVGQRG